MNIGIDIDGVLTNLERELLDYGTKMCIEENWPIHIDVNQYKEQNIFNWTKEQADKFWDKYLIKYITESPIRTSAPEILKKLQKEGNKIYFITARSEKQIKAKRHGKMQKLTKKWLKKYNIKYEKLILAPDEEKLQKCIENNVGVMIEDSPSNIKYMSEKMKVIKFYSQYNKEIENENIITAYSWNHIYNIITEMKNTPDYI